MTRLKKSFWVRGVGLTGDGDVAGRSRNADQRDGVQAGLGGQGQRGGQGLELHAGCQQTLENKTERLYYRNDYQECRKHGTRKWTQNTN